MKTNGHDCFDYQRATLETVMQYSQTLTKRLGVITTYETSLDLAEYNKYLELKKKELPELADEITYNYNTEVFKNTFGAVQLGQNIMASVPISFPYLMDPKETREQLKDWRRELDCYVAANTDYSRN